MSIEKTISTASAEIATHPPQEAFFNSIQKDLSADRATATTPLRLFAVPAPE